MKGLIQWRQREVNAVYREKELIDVLVVMSHKLEEYMEGILSTRKKNPAALTSIHFCYYFSPVVDLDEMEEKQQINIEVNPLDSFMEVHQFDRMASNMAGIVTYFELDQEIRKMAEVLCTFQDSCLFNACWEKEAKLVSEEISEYTTIATPEMIHEDIFRPAYEKYENIYTSLKDGHIKLAQIDELFGNYRDKYDELTQQLDMMCQVEKGSDKNWIHQRVQQIEQYHELHLAAASAKIIMMVKETLGLQGDFKALETLMEAVSGHVLKSFITFLH